MKIKANKELSDQIKCVTIKMMLVLPAIIKDGIEIPDEEIEKYFELWGNLEDELSVLYDRVEDWVYGDG